MAYAKELRITMVERGAFGNVGKQLKRFI